MRNKRKGSRTYYRNKADKLFSQIVRSLGYCLKCGKTGRIDAAHIISRRFSNTRHDLRNGMPLCVGCHRWGHDRPTEFARFAEKVKGKKTIRELERKSRLLTKPDYKQIAEELSGKIE